jgi:hypothetical protein
VLTSEKRENRETEKGWKEGREEGRKEGRKYTTHDPLI